MGVVSRAELKLADAVRDFRYDFRGKVVLDIGSSTGGFTELALRQGARRVIAVEKGTGQMKAPLRFDARIELHEKTDIFEVVGAVDGAHAAADGAVKVERPDVILADVSFVSLRKVLAYVRKWLAGPETDFLVMLKPQFEAYPDQLVRGVVKNERMRREIVRDFERWAQGQGFLIVKKRDNKVVGKNGNRERFYWLKMVG